MTVDNNEASDFDNSETEHRYWETSLDGSRRTFGRQNQAIFQERERLHGLIKYHLFFIGFVFTVAAIPGLSDIDLAGVHVALICSPSVIAVFYLSIEHHSLGSYHIGLDAEAHQTNWEMSETYTDALKTMTQKYNEATNRNHQILNKHQKYRSKGLILLSMSFGALLASVILWL